MAKFYSGPINGHIMTIHVEHSAPEQLPKHMRDQGVIIKEIKEAPPLTTNEIGKMVVRKLNLDTEEIFYDIVDREFTSEEELKSAVDGIESTNADLTFQMLETDGRAQSAEFQAAQSLFQVMESDQVARSAEEQAAWALFQLMEEQFKSMELESQAADLAFSLLEADGKILEADHQLAIMTFQLMEEQAQREQIDIENDSFRTLLSLNDQKTDQALRENADLLYVLMEKGVI